MLAHSAPTRRLVIFAISHAQGGIDEYVFHALEAIAPLASRVIAIVPPGAVNVVVDRVRAAVDQVHSARQHGFDAREYARVVATQHLADIDEIVFTGDSWFGPLTPLSAALDRLQGTDAPIRALIQRPGRPLDSFPEAGFATPVLPWTWTAIDVSVVESAEWRQFWASGLDEAPRGESEAAFQLQLDERGISTAFAFPSDAIPVEDPAVFAPGLLIDAGCPLLLRATFLLYPPYLDRMAVIGREILERVDSIGFPMDLVRRNLARSVQPKALYSIAAMLEVLPDDHQSYDRLDPQRIAVVLHVTDLAPVSELLDRLSVLPTPYHLVLTTTDGKRAAKLQRMVDRRDDPLIAAADVRVTPRNRGRDMSDFFVACRDVLLSGRFDLVFKLHARRMSDKTDNLARYFRRYQYENLLNSPGYIENLIALFQRDPHLGVVFPPMMHIGYALMGHAWGGHESAARELAAELGIHVPFDLVSPLAPLGGMWVCRPEALALLADRRWQYRDYSKRAHDGSGELARVQERLVAYAAAELGYRSGTVLTREHASISHTALESKTDYLFSTTRGWPVEQIQLLQRAGDAGQGGVVALVRMYIGVNHPRLARVTRPLFVSALRAVVVMKYARKGLRVALAVIAGRNPEVTR